MAKYLMVNVPEELAQQIETAVSQGTLMVPVGTFSELIGHARRLEDERKEPDKYSNPKAPLDVPAEVWQAVANQYHDAQWTPAPNYHAEYRDCRVAFQATVELVAKRLWDWDRQAAKFVQDILTGEQEDASNQ